MCEDQKQFASKMIGMEEVISKHQPSMKKFQGSNFSQNEIKFIQYSIREYVVDSILQNGVKLRLKLQTSHIASMYFEIWLDKQKREDLAQSDKARKWTTRMRMLNEQDLRS